MVQQPSRDAAQTRQLLQSVILWQYPRHTAGVQSFGRGQMLRSSGPVLSCCRGSCVLLLLLGV